MARARPWVTPSELAEYTFCPRAHHYRQRSAAPPTPAATAGARYHRRVLGAERWRDEHRYLPWLVIGVGALLIVLAIGGGLR